MFIRFGSYSSRRVGPCIWNSARGEASLSSFVPASRLAVSFGARDEAGCAQQDAHGARAYTRPWTVSRQPPALLHHVPSSRSRTYTCSFSLSLSLLFYHRPTDRPKPNRPIHRHHNLANLFDCHVVESKVDQSVLHHRGRRSGGLLHVRAVDTLD